MTLIIRDHDGQREMTIFADSENFYPGLDVFERMMKFGEDVPKAICEYDYPHGSSGKMIIF